MTAADPTQPALFGEDFEVYPTGSAITLACQKCEATHWIIGRMTLAALVNEAVKHAGVCQGTEA